MALVAYFGGKSGKAFHDLINSKIPKIGITTYLEPFSGSFGTYMEDETLNFETVIFNDKNRHQVNLYKCGSQPESFLKEIYNLLKKGGVLYTELTDVEEKWNFYREIYREYTKNDFLDNMDFEIGDFKIAAIYAFLITSSFSSVYPRGGGFSGYKKDKDRLKLETLISKLKKGTYTAKLQSIDEYLNIDFEELIRKYDSPETYIYLDPPYFRPDENGEDDAKRLFWYGADKEGMFGPASHRRLLELIKNVEARWSLSYYYFPLLEELLPKDKYIWFEKEVFRSSAHGGNNSSTKGEQAKGVELLILNYNPETGEKIN
jgi:site-specific DNA-adenine methylase